MQKVADNTRLPANLVAFKQKHVSGIEREESDQHMHIINDISKTGFESHHNFKQRNRKRIWTWYRRQYRFLLATSSSKEKIINMFIYQ